ncbi:uncharacterized protein [Triticum aestivum]|uniref:uncharacterized protein isoform X2 n=1 Tax=Triticum aestivum TaxID=4565 RepID=UPI001D023DA5|nr:uncharacterized protein LOC123059361 isoform X2 [Triticum aestivum]
MQTRIQSMVDKNIKLVDVIQVMLVRRILPCQSRTCPLWEFDLKKHQTLERLFGTTHEDAWKLLFKGNETPPAMDSDRGHDITHHANAVWTERVERIHYSAPPPKEPVIPLRAKMLVPAPYKAPEKKAKKKAKGVRSGLRRKGASDVSSEDKTLSSAAEDDDEEEEENTSPVDGGRKKRAASKNLEAEEPKRGKGPPADNSA